MDKTFNPSARDTLVLCESGRGVEIKGSVLRYHRRQVVFEIYTPSVVIQTAEVLNNFRLIAADQTLYSGRATVSNIIHTGMVTLCEADLEDSWLDVEFTTSGVTSGRLAENFQEFFGNWQSHYKIAPEFKSIVADIQSFLYELRLWIQQLELGVRAAPSGDRLQLEHDAIRSVEEPAMAAIDHLFGEFETIVQQIEPARHSVHKHYMQRQLHSLVLCSPFAYRTFAKPLGYAGDYEMVNMIGRDPLEGGSMFAKILNLWFLRQAPAVAHRNRIDYLITKITEETLAAKARGQNLRAFNLGCGPALEIQRLLADDRRLAEGADLTLVDFNDETIAFAQERLGKLKQQHGRNCNITFLKKSVQQYLKEGSKSLERPPDQKYSLVYCAGLFDYLPDQICKRLMTLFYDWVSPGGLLLATNVDVSNPRRHTMNFILDWNLVYRSAAQSKNLKPPAAPAGAFSVCSDFSGVNIFLEVRKPL